MESSDARWSESTTRFTALLALPEADLPLDEAAFLIAAHAHPDLNLDDWLVRLDEIAGRCVGARTPGDLAHALFVVEGFAGNTDDYSDPRNSLLDDVIDRRLGIPITLSVVMIEVGRRIGLPLHGVGMPGHFLVGVDDAREEFVDPFHAGRVLDVDGCREVFAALHGPAAPFSPALLAPTGSRAILMRMLNNLQRSYLERGSRDAAWVARLLLRFPELSVPERRRAATLLGALARFTEAAVALEGLVDSLDESDAAVVAAEARALRARRELSAMPTKSLPMFPLGTVLFPYGVLPLHVFEPRYRELVEVCLASEQEFGVVLIERGSEVGGGDTRFVVGTVARIVEAAQLPDGRYALVTVGTSRLRVHEWLPDDPYPQATVEVLLEASLEVPGPDEPSLEPTARLLRRVLGLAAEMGVAVPNADVQLSADPVRAAFEAASIAPLGAFDAQRLLEVDDPVARITMLDALLTDTAELLELRLRSDG